MEHFCEFEFGPLVQEKSSKIFPIYSSGGPCSILVDGIIRNICVKLF